MKWPAFAYAKPTTLDALWAERAAAPADAKLLAGGQSLLATLAFRLSAPSKLIDITAIEALRGIAVTDGGLRLGALTRHADLLRDAEVRRRAPLLAEAAGLIGHVAIRNRGTLGGSLAYADPAAELPACMIALGATIVAASPRGERRIPARLFFTGLFETALAEDEILAAVEVPAAQPGQLTGIAEIARRSGDFAMAGLACSLAFTRGAVSEARLVFFALGDTAVSAASANAALAGQPLSEATIAAAAEAVSDHLDPPADLHGTSEMKLHLARVLTRRVLRSFLASGSAAA